MKYVTHLFADDGHGADVPQLRLSSTTRRPNWELRKAKGGGFSWERMNEGMRASSVAHELEQGAAVSSKTSRNRKMREKVKGMADVKKKVKARCRMGSLVGHTS